MYLPSSAEDDTLVAEADDCIDDGDCRIVALAQEHAERMQAERLKFLGRKHGKQQRGTSCFGEH